MRKYTWQELSMKSIKGPFSKYLNAQETALLVNLVNGIKPKVMIEFGCNNGMTAQRVLDNVPTLERYIGIDVLRDHVPTLACQLSEVPDNPGGYASEDERFFIHLTKAKIFIEDLEPADAVFIDGDHSATAVRHDSLLAMALLRPGGIIVWHDYGNPAVEVTEVLDEFERDGCPINYIEGSWLAFMRGDNYADEAA